MGNLLPIFSIFITIPGCQTLKLILHQFDLPLQHVFTISRGSVRVQKTLVVELTDGVHHGYGEATTNTYYGATIEKMSRALETLRSMLSRIDQVDPGRLWEEAAARLGGNPFALCALDEAAHDLWGKQQGKPVHQLWGLDSTDCPLSNFTIGIDTVENMVLKMREVPGWPIYKIKLGTDYDLEIIRQLRTNTDAVFRVDANCGWNAEQAIRYSRQMKPLGVEFLEQPLPADDLEGMRRLYQESALPVIADESCISEQDVKTCHGMFHGVNIKLVKCGGLTPARRMIDQARKLNMRVMVGCMTESTVGISAIAQLLPLLDYVDMDGAALLASDIAKGARLENGRCIYPEGNGSGVELLDRVESSEQPEAIE
jgi:L-Ala-D/L-Glu epimerase / N-acetyl-D-glutamate racemase